MLVFQHPEESQTPTWSLESYYLPEDTVQCSGQ